jgi:hypothetical protein
VGFLIFETMRVEPSGVFQSIFPMLTGKVHTTGVSPGAACGYQ